MFVALWQYFSFVPSFTIVVHTLTLCVQVLFVHIDTTSDDSSRVAEFFNIGDDDVPTCRLINLEADMRKFVPEFDGIDMEKLAPWIEDYLTGNLKVRTYMSRILGDSCTDTK